MTQHYALLGLLADGRFRSGEDLGAALGVSRAAVWKMLKSLGEMGIDVHAVRGKGYRLAYPLELLDETAIAKEIGEDVRDHIPVLELLPEIDSTNRYLMAKAAQGAGTGHACLAEWQRAGRGRRGRTWVSPFGCNVYLSILWRFDDGAAGLAGLSTALGVGVARALAGAGIDEVGLKWPNDVLVEGRKLAGVLVELTGESAGPCHVVAGIGVNGRMAAAPGAMIDQPWTDLHRLTGGRGVSRNRLAGLLLSELVRVLRVFEAQGLSPFLEAWRLLDVAAGRTVELRLPDRVVAGRAAGIDSAGALLVETDSGPARYLSGEVSLRVQS